MFEETNFLGGGLTKEEGGQGIETPNPEGCSAECKKRPACNYWTFVKQWKVNCYLKSRLGEKAEFEGGTSGTYSHFCDSLNGASRPRIASSSSPSSSSTRLNKRPNKLQNKKLIPDGSGCRYEGVNIQGGDLAPKEGGHGIETRDADHCRSECGDKTGCTFWTFVKQWRVNCYLKNAKGPERELEGATSGSLFVSCDQEANDELGELGDQRTSDHECAYDGLTFMGADLPASQGGLGITTDGAEGCRARCLQSPYCKHWVSVKDWRVNCYLKADRVTPERKDNAVAGSIGVRCLPGATGLSGTSSAALDLVTRNNFRPVAPTNNRKDHCTYQGLNYQGGDLPDNLGGNGIEAERWEDCAAECEKRSECQFWTHVKDWKVSCYLKDSFTDTSNKEGATSGSIGVKCDENYSPPVASDSPPAQEKDPTYKPRVPSSPRQQEDNVCFFHDANLIGGDLPESKNGNGIATPDANMCAVTCYQQEGCRYWVWVQGWKQNCFLKSHFEEEESFPGATSGSVGLSCD